MLNEFDIFAQGGTRGHALFGTRGRPYPHRGAIRTPHVFLRATETLDLRTRGLSPEPCSRAKSQTRNLLTGASRSRVRFLVSSSSTLIERNLREGDESRAESSGC